MRVWAKMHAKCVRLRNVRQDNTMYTTGTLSLNVYETNTVLKLINLNLLIDVERVPSEIGESPNEEANFPQSPKNKQIDCVSDNDCFAYELITKS